MNEYSLAKVQFIICYCHGFFTNFMLACINKRKCLVTYITTLFSF